ncbi:hypothetical protein OTB20_18010 [Streptomyces sp. H27-H1]|nr:hypothetical protein [Streptomyces sp. H27-H1]MCY0928054.1 hypothetical protein [Streptomyces sp. H27-H1]
MLLERERGRRRLLHALEPGCELSGLIRNSRSSVVRTREVAADRVRHA